MSIFGVGIDIVQISRIETILLRRGDRFMSRILGKSEMEILPVREKRLAGFLAGRIAAKEAAAKALGTGMSKGLSFQQLEILNDETGRPFLCVSEEVRKLSKSLGVANFFVSLSDEKTHACAVVICERVAHHLDRTENLKQES